MGWSNGEKLNKWLIFRAWLKTGHEPLMFVYARRGMPSTADTPLTQARQILCINGVKFNAEVAYRNPNLTNSSPFFFEKQIHHYLIQHTGNIIKLWGQFGARAALSWLENIRSRRTLTTGKRDICTGYWTGTQHPVQMWWSICTARDIQYKCLTFVPGGASTRYKCVLPRQPLSFLFLFLFISFLFLISFYSHLIQSRFKVTKFTSILIKNLQQFSSQITRFTISPWITISMNLTVIHRISHKLESIHPHKTTDGTRKSHTNSSQK
jgi:hypothetical protein